MQTNSFSILLVLVIGYFSFVGSAQSQPATTHCQRARIVQHRRFYDVSASYPVVKDLPNAIKLNHLIKNFVQSQIDDYQRGIGKYDGNQGKGYLNVVYNASLATKDVFSVRFQLTKYSPGAAHPLDETNAINFCPSPGEILSLKDIFRADVDYPKVLSVLCMGDLLQRTEPPDLDSLLSGAGAESANFEHFSLSRDSMSIYFDEYQLGAYAQGESTVKLAYSKFGDLLAPECAVSSLAAKCPANPNDPIQITRKHLQQDLAILAISALSKAITEGPSDPTAYHQRAYWYQKLGRKEAAEADLKQATSLEKAADTPASVEKAEDNPVDSTSQTKIDSAATKEVDQAIDQPLAEAGARIISRTQLAEPLGGIGARIHVDKGNLLVVKIIPETPASNAGLQSGDRITAIDGEPTDGLSEAEAASLIRGPVGSDVSLSICRKNDEGNIKVIKIKRALIKSLSWLH